MVNTKMGNDFAGAVTILSCQNYKLKNMAKVEQRVVGFLWNIRREKYFLIDIYNIKSYARQLERKRIKRRNKFTEINFWRHLVKIFLSILSVEEGAAVKVALILKFIFHRHFLLCVIFCATTKKKYEKKN